MPIDDLAPCSGAHAVQSAVFAIEWAKPLPPDLLSAVKKAYDDSAELRQQLPACVPQNMLSVRIDNAGGAPSTSSMTSSGDLVGYQFSRFRMPNFVARSAQISRDNFVVIVSDYTRWRSVLDEVVATVKALVTPVLEAQTIPVAAIGLQYTDVFHWRAAPNTLNLKEVFSSQTKLIPASALEQTNLWHNHHGYFVDLADPVPCRLTENVNTEIVEQSGQRSIGIVTAHRAQLAQNSFIWKIDELETKIAAVWELLHSRNKNLLRDILSEEVKTKIKLEG